MTESTPRTPLAPARRAHILDALARDGVVRNSELIEELGVTPVTLRRDLAQMEQDGLIARVHGGALPTSDGAADAAATDSPVEPGSRGLIAILVPSLNFYWPTVVSGIEAEAKRHGFGVLLRGASYELQDERPALERLVRSENVRGLVVAPNTDMPHAQQVVQWLSECGVPTVLAERDAFRLPGKEPMESVTTDHALGAMLAARHLAALGHRKVGLVISRNSPTSRKIAAGWEAACRELGMTAAQHFEHQLPQRTSPDFSATVNATIDIAIATGTTGLLVHSDPEAMACVDLALNRGISVPEDLSVIAYDDEVAQLFTPSLTAVSPPRIAVGEVAADLLIRRLDDPDRPIRRVVLSPTINVRESTAPPTQR